METTSFDEDQQAILYVYSKYSAEKDAQYLQYTAALVLFYYLMKKGIFPSYKEQLLVYDYKDSRRYMWEDKKFMADINHLRDLNLLGRARLKTACYRDMNAHYCTDKGHEYIEAGNISSINLEKIDHHLQCKCKRNLRVVLNDDCPILQCDKHKKSKVTVDGFLYKLSEPIEHRYVSSFL